MSNVYSDAGARTGAVHPDIAIDLRQVTAGAAVEMEAEAAVRSKYESLGGAGGYLGAASGGFGTCPDGVGYFQHYAGGSIYYSPNSGAWSVHGAIRDLWAQIGWEQGVLGYPVSDEGGCPDNVGRFNHFQKGSIYFTPALGAHEVHGAIHQLWAQMGWERGLGYPVSDEGPAPDAGGTGRVSTFTGGTIAWTPVGGAHAIKGAVPRTLDYDAGWLTVPDPDALAGFAHVTLGSDGSAHFTGHAHDGTILAGYDFTVAGLIVDVTHQAYAFSHSGHCTHSSDVPWDERGTNPLIAANWLSLCATPSPSVSPFQLRANRDFSGLIDEIASALKTAGDAVSAVETVVTVASALA